MKNSTRLFIQDLDSRGILYSVEREGFDDEPDVISVQYVGDNMKDIRTLMFFSDSDVCYKIFSIAKVPNAKRAAVLEKINELHNQWRWISLAIDGDNEIFSELDVFCSETNIEICTLGLFQIVDITDKCYPEIMKAIWA